MTALRQAHSAAPGWKAPPVLCASPTNVMRETMKTKRAVLCFAGVLLAAPLAAASVPTSAISRPDHWLIGRSDCSSSLLRP